MNDYEKFEGLKKSTLEENENLYGDELREKFGSESVNKANMKFLNKTPEAYKEAEELADEILEVLSEAMESGDASSVLAKKAAMLHKEWICHYWETYSVDAHIGLVDMYMNDERFKAYYDKIKPGMTSFLRDAVYIHLKQSISI